VRKDTTGGIASDARPVKIAPARTAPPAWKPEARSAAHVRAVTMATRVIRVTSASWLQVRYAGMAERAGIARISATPASAPSDTME